MLIPSMPKVSVVMSVYNGERYLSESIESVLGQTYRDFEFIVIDDGSVDNTPKILARYAEYDQRIKVISQDNHGLAASLNKGIQIARGQWIARMDADDVCLPNRLSKQLELLESTHSDVCGGWTRLIGSRTWRTRRYEECDDAIKLQLCFRTAFAHPTVVMKTSLARMNPYSENVQRGQDYDLWARLALAGARMTNLQSVILRYRIHSLQTAHTNRAEMISHRNCIQKHYVDHMLNWPGACIVMRKFAFPSDAPSIEEARELKDIMMSIQWASEDAILRTYLAALRYVQPQSYNVYRLYKDMCNKFNKPINIDSLSLLTQSLLGLSADKKVYKFIKRFI